MLSRTNVVTSPHPFHTHARTHIVHRLATVSFRTCLQTNPSHVLFQNVKKERLLSTFSCLATHVKSSKLYIQHVCNSTDNTNMVIKKREVMAIEVRW